MLQHITSVHDFNVENLTHIFGHALMHKLGDILRPTNSFKFASKPVIMASLFYEPSTRTRFSFESAMKRLGGEVISTENAVEFSSAIKGETLEDSIRVIDGYSDFIVLRHPEENSVQSAARVSTVPIINAGDGSGEHPTQALLDLFTIRERFPDRKDLTITFVGDLKFGRTIHSLVRLLAELNGTSLETVVHINLVGPKEFGTPKKYTDLLSKENVSFAEIQDNITKDVVEKSDIVYMTRVQRERHGNSGFFDQSMFILTKDLVQSMPKDSIIMHPLPRNIELPREIDTDPRAYYFEQAENGLYVRMALLMYLYEVSEK